MPDYKYQGTSRSGGSVSGVMTASNKTELASLLKRQQITATKMTEKGKEFNMPQFGGGVNAKELAIFTRQFSVMIDAGLPLVQCLEILATQQENKFFQKVLINTRAQVEGGATLSAAMRGSPKVFDPLYVNMVEAGETGGILDTILQRLSTYIEKNVKLQRAVKSALVYPVGVLTVAGASSSCCSGKSCRFSPPCLRALAWTSRCPRKSSSLSVISSAAFLVCSSSWPSGALSLV